MEVWWYTSYICLEYSLPSGAWKAFTEQMGATEKLKKNKNKYLPSDDTTFWYQHFDTSISQVLPKATKALTP